MKRRTKSSTLLLLILIFFISFLALTAAPYNHSQLLKFPKVNMEEAIVFSAFSVFSGCGQGGAMTLLNQTTRMDIYSFVKGNPGVHFRALSDYLSLPIGVLQYHLGLLVHGGLLSIFQDGRYKRYFESKRFTEAEMKIISILRHETAGGVLAALLEEPLMTHKDLAARLHISSQALSWQINRLVKMGFIQSCVEGLNVRYSLDETMYAEVSQCLTLLNTATTQN